jgi:putative flippase GtrA
VGAANTAFNYGIYVVLIYIGLGHIAAASISFAIGLLVNFRTQGNLVFKTRNKNSFKLYVVSWIGIYFVNIGSLDLLVRMGVNSYLAGALIIPPIAILAFLVLRFVVFRQTKTSSEVIVHRFYLEGEPPGRENFICGTSFQW